MEPAKPASIRSMILAQIGEFLFNERFIPQPFIQHGIFEIINLLSDYQEEGRMLFPEVLVTNELDLLKTIPDYKVPIGSYEVTVEVFKKIVKDCAPLCTSEWVIYIEIKDGRLNFGLTCAELTETTPSLYQQTVGDLKVDLEGCTVAYIRNIGKKTVELKGLRSYVIVPLSLDNPDDLSVNDVGKLAKHICRSLTGSMQETAKGYFEKILSEAFREGHGNLVGVIEYTVAATTLLKERIPNGNYLPFPIDLVEILQTFEAEKSAINSVALRQYSSIIKAMCNNDGITIFTTDGKLLAYHVIITTDYVPSQTKMSIIGGARTTAFYNLQHCGALVFALMKSQDGPIKTFSIYE